MSRSLHDNAVIDEFTSVVNRECAISCSTSISKYIRNNDLKNIVFASCHDDIIEYLQPDWIYDTDKQELSGGKITISKNHSINGISNNPINISTLKIPKFSHYVFHNPILKELYILHI